MSANLPPLPEPDSASSAIKCATCGASYKPGYSLMPQGNGFSSLIRQTACQGCGGTSFTASIGYDSSSPAKYTAGQMRAYATKAVAAQAAELEALRADAERYRIWRHEFTGNESDEATPVIIALNDAWTPEAVDAVLDAARAALKEQTPNVRANRPDTAAQE